MNFLCPSCRTPLPAPSANQSVDCTQCGVVVDLTGVDTAPGQAKLWPQIDLASETLGGFKLERTLGAGGMGAVYAATGPEGAQVAVKVLAPLLAAEPGLRERFRREAHALRAINHPGVVRILDEGEERGFCWYAMERIDGSDLREVLKKGRMSTVDAEKLARALLEALVAVHAAGLVHRDIKPGNVLLSADGPKLCDFGIARFDGQSTLTESAAILGSLRYMAPEQRWGKSGPLSDLYGVGVVLHEALWGGVPGEVATDGKVPEWLSDFVMLMVSARAEDRPSSATAALKVLALYRTRRRRQILGAGALVAAALAVGGGVAYPSLRHSSEPAVAGVPKPARVVAAKPPVVVVVPDAGPPAVVEAVVDAGPAAPLPPEVLAVKPAPPAPPPKGKPTKRPSKVTEDMSAVLRTASKPEPTKGADATGNEGKGKKKLRK